MNILTLFLLYQVIGIILIIFAAICESVMDTLIFHYTRSKFIKKQNELFWNPKESWKNKYKEDLETPKFIGSTTLFVFTTDAWHLFKFLRNVLIFCGIPLVAFFSVSVINLFILLLLSRLMYGLFFTYYYRYYSNKKIF